MATETVPTPRGAERELTIEIYPRGFDIWVGSRAQLEAEGLIPDSLEWPSGTASHVWQHDGFEYWLKRCRPDDMTGPMKLWANGDHWFFRRCRPERDGFAAARLYEREQELRREKLRQSGAFAQLDARWLKSQCSDAFQRFKQLVPALAPKPRRRGVV